MPNLSTLPDLWGQFDAVDALYDAAVAEFDLADFNLAAAIDRHHLSALEVERLKGIYATQTTRHSENMGESKKLSGIALLETGRHLTVANSVRRETGVVYVTAITARATARRVMKSFKRQRDKTLSAAQLQDAMERNVSDHELNVQRRRKARLEQQKLKDAEHVHSMAIKQNAPQYRGIVCDAHPDLRGQRWTESQICVACTAPYFL